MVGLAGFALTVFFITLSGVLPPGPLMAMTVSCGSDDPHAGLRVALGHALVELPLMAAVYFGAGLAFRYDPVKAAVGGLGGMALLWMGVALLRSARAETPAVATPRRPLAAGAAVSAANPYFWVWWATAGATLFGQSLLFGAVGFAAVAVVHLACDFGWCWLLSGLSFRGKKFFGRRLTQAMNVAAALVLFYFGGSFLVGAALLAAK